MPSEIKHTKKQYIYIFATTHFPINIYFSSLSFSFVFQTPRYHRMSPGIADQLLLLIDEVEELTMEIFMSVQNQTPSDNLVEMLIKKDRELAQLLQVANEQKQLYDKIENVIFDFLLNKI